MKFQRLMMFALVAILIFAAARWLWLYGNAYKRLTTNAALSDQLNDESANTGQSVDRLARRYARQEANTRFA